MPGSRDDSLRRDFRPDIQGLRALAVVLVVGYHLFPGAVSGGYVGVDVFFVLSGYLITSQLHREVVTTGRLSLTAFWARRIRRLLPASLLVLVVCAGATWAWVPRTLWDQTLRQLTASALYVQNWVLADDAVDYLGLGDSPTLVQHYWSLAIEEQFYLVWPPLVAAALYAARRVRVDARRLLVVTITAAGLASFAYSVVETAGDAARAYFVTPTRAWELAAGALLAVVGAEGRASRRVEQSTSTAVVLGWVGLAAVLWSGLVLTSATPFPGWTVAIPVLGTAALVETGSRSNPVAASRLLALRPLTFLGDISYAIYLWHWPMIVVLPYITGVPLRLEDKVGIAAVTLVLSWASTRWVEDPARTGRLLTLNAWRPYALGAGGMAFVLLLAATLSTDVDRDIEQAQVASAATVDAALEADQPCVGPAALDADHPASCGSVAGDGPPVLEPAAVARETTDRAFERCQTPPTVAAEATCTLGTTGTPTRTVAVVGDSHAAHWLLPLDALGKERGWRVRTFSRSGCAFTDARPLRNSSWPESRYPLCWRGNDAVERDLLADPAIDTVFVSADSSSYHWAQPSGGSLPDPATDGFRSLWARLVAAGKQVVVIRDVPETLDHGDVPTCLAQHADDPDACATPRAEGLARDVEADAVEGAASGVHLIDLSDQFCDDRLCYARIGDVIVYRDVGHLADEYARLLTPYLGAAFDAVDAHRPAESGS